VIFFRYVTKAYIVDRWDLAGRRDLSLPWSGVATCKSSLFTFKVELRIIIYRKSASVQAMPEIQNSICDGLRE